MGRPGRRWTVQDRYGNPIYLTEERWNHITNPTNHPEMVAYEPYLKKSLRRGHRRQEPLNPRKYRYAHPFDDLPDAVNHLVAIVLFGFEVDEHGHTRPNNFVVTAFFKYIQLKG